MSKTFGRKEVIFMDQVQREGFGGLGHMSGGGGDLSTETAVSGETAVSDETVSNDTN